MILLALLLGATPPDCGALRTQTDMNICEGERAKRADVTLNASWRKLTARAGASGPAYLAAQRLWLQFRKAECDAQGKSYAGGSMQPMVVADCYADLTEARAVALDRLETDH